MLPELAADAFAAVDGALERQRAELHSTEIGVVLQVSSGIARVQGLPGVRAEELIRFPGGGLGVALGLDADTVGVILLGAEEDVHAGDEAHRTGRVVDVPVGPELLGRVLDPVGRPLDDGAAPTGEARWAIERDAPAILDRAPVSRPLQTGLKAVDALIPIGRGQRELIVGDRQTGKTAIALDAMLNQQGTGVICIYCAIGQRSAAVAKVVSELRARKALDHSVVVVAGGEEPPGLQYIAPYAATTIGEYFMRRGRDVLVVYDDLTRHARAYRELSLLLRRPPGREAYPGDIFYIHARLLERATHLSDEHGGGSLTALPIIETQAQNISAYIPTNLISITDGQIYVSPELFHLGMLPAVDVGKSVSRVGGRAQLPAYRAVAGRLRLAYAQYEELETFARFSTRLDERTRRQLERGRRVREMLKQREHELYSAAEQIAVLLPVSQGAFDAVPLEALAAAAEAVRAAVMEACAELCAGIEDGAELDDARRDAILETARRTLESGEFAAERREAGA